jgi:hypothetical protein
VGRTVQGQGPRRCGPREAARAGVHRFGAHHPPCGRAPSRRPTGRACAGAPALGHRAGDVAAVRLRRRAGRRRREDGVVRGVAGLVEVPGGAADPGQDDAERVRRPGRDVPAAGWGADLCADRQREDRHGRAHRRDPGPEPAAGGVRRALLGGGAHLCPGRSGVQGRHRVVGEDQQGRLVPKDTNLREEYASFAELEAACAAFCEKVNTRPHRVTRRPPVEMLAEERARLHPVPMHPAHGRVRDHPGGAGEHADGDVRVRPVLGPAPAARCDGVGPCPRCRGGRAGRHRPRR